MQRRDFLSAVPLVVGFAASRALRAQSKSVSVLEYGAKPNGRTLNTRAIQSAVDDVSRAGGGTVTVPAGTFLTGRVELRSRITLHLETGSTLLGSTSIHDYEASGGSLTGAGSNSRHLIFAVNADDLAITGPGRIDGQGPTFWEPSGKVPLAPAEEWADVASHDLAVKKSGRPSPMIELVNCKRLRIEGIHVENAPGWTMRIVNSDTVDIRGITINNPVNGPNTDGIDITGCQNVTVSNCAISTGDDAICLKSENPYGPEPLLLKKILVTQCRLSTCCNGFKLGTSSEGGFEDITFSDSVIFNNEVPYRERVISGVALEVVDGGWIDGVVVRNIEMQRTRTPIFLRLENRKRSRDAARNGLRNVHIEDVHATEALLASSITGLPGLDVRGVSLSRISVENVLPGTADLVGRSIPEKETAYPEARMFGMLPASGLYARHVRDLDLRDLTFAAPAGEGRPTILFDDVEDARVTGVQSSPIEGSMPVLLERHSRDVKLIPSKS